MIVLTNKKHQSAAFAANADLLDGVGLFIHQLVLNDRFAVEDARKDKTSARH